VGHRLDAQDLERSATLRVLEALRGQIERLGAEVAKASLGSVGNLEPEPSVEPVSGESDAAVAPGQDTAALPQLPREVNPRLTFRQVEDVTDLLKDERLNPAGKQVDELTLAKMRVEFARRRGEVEVLEAEMYQELTQARSALRERGEYIEYAPGEKYASEPGTLTAAEPLPGGGVRMFYLQQAEFPELYAKRAERDAHAERSLRDLLNTLGDS
jgi:hypothetical protein